MAANKSKIKGSAFESKVVKILNEEIQEITFIRVPLSGSVANMKGDIMPKLEFYHLWPYCIEAKHYKEVNWNGLLTAKSSDLLNFWRQAVREAKDMNKHPLLIYRWDRSKDYICWDSDLELNHQITCSVFDCKFKMGLLDDWLLEYNKINIKS